MPPELSIFASSVLHDPIVTFITILGVCASIGLGFLGHRVLRLRRALTTITCLALWGVILVMFFAGGRALESPEFDPTLLTSCGTGESSRDFVLADTEGYLNAILYAPFAVSLTLLIRRWWLSLATCIGAIFILEALQAVTNSGVCSQSDIAQNLVGAILGVVVTAVLSRCRHLQSTSSN
ncbi:MAG: VanZ family protein [Micromonosporaceae bacterium]|nr:VanZ family protein [Micromonosporaceae bacterium]